MYSNSILVQYVKVEVYNILESKNEEIYNGFIKVRNKYIPILLDSAPTIIAYIYTAM